MSFVAISSQDRLLDVFIGVARRANTAPSARTIATLWAHLLLRACLCAGEFLYITDLLPRRCVYSVVEYTER